MAKVKIFSTFANKAAGGNLTIKGDINVDANGIFYFKLEEDHIPYAEDYIKTGHRIDKDVRLYVAGRNNNNLYCPILDVLESALKAICYKISQSGVTEELVIRYYIENYVSYYKKDGVIYSSGSDAGDGYSKGEGEWLGADGNSLDFFAVKIYAKVMLKTTQTGSNEVDYTNPGFAKDRDTFDIHNEHGSVEGNKWEYLHKLNRFLLGWKGTEKFQSSGQFKEMPYSETRAKFFYEMMLGMCKLADKFSILEDHDTVMQLADTGKALLMAPEEKKK